MLLKDSSHNMRADIHPIDISSSPAGADIVAFFEDILRSGISIRVRVTGKSMSPFLEGGETLTIKRVPCHSLRKGDLIFFKTSAEAPVIHRIVGVRREEGKAYSFRTKGDAVRTMDDRVPEKDILGKVCRIEKPSSKNERRSVDMEIPLWKGLNFSLALISLGRSKIASHPSLAGVLRRIKKALV